MSSIIKTPEKYIDFNSRDIAAMCVDVALTVAGKDHLGFNQRRILRNTVANNQLYKQRLEEIAEYINTLGKEISVDLYRDQNE